MSYKYKKVIFVCNDNTCRGPMAEVIFKRFAAEMDMEAPTAPVRRFRSCPDVRRWDWLLKKKHKRCLPFVLFLL